MKALKKTQFAHIKLKTFGAAPKEVLANVGGGAQLEVLRTLVAKLKHTVAELEELGSETLDGFVHRRDIEEMDAHLSEYVNHEIKEADDAMTTQGAALAKLVGVDDSFKAVWHVGAGTMEELVTKSEVLKEGSRLKAGGENFRDALQKCKDLRQRHVSDVAMPEGSWDTLGKNVEVARFSLYAISAIAKKAKVKKYGDQELKDDLIREMKHVRKVLTREQEAQFIPAVLLKEVLAHVWSHKK